MIEDFGLNTTPTFRIEGDAYIVEFPLSRVTVEATRMEPSKSEIYGLIRVTSTLPGVPELIHSGRFNFTSTSARTTLVKYLAQRADVADWAEVVEQTCHRVLESLRTGQPVVRMGDIAERVADRFRVSPIIVEGFPTIIFGPGGSGKSLLGMLMAMAVQGAWQLANLEVIPGEVLVCDWELDAVTYKEQASMLAAGFGIDLPEIHYRQCFAPLAEEGAAIGRYVAGNNIALVVVDSLGYAVGGDKTSQDLTMRMFAAIRAWQTTVLCIDHVVNDDSGGLRPFGSAYTGNSARALWRVRSEQEEGSNELNIGLFQTKANFGKQPPIGFRVRFEDGATSVERADVRDMPAMRPNLSASMRIKTALTEGRRSMTVADIVEATTLKEEIVRARLADLVKRGDVVKIPDVTQSAARYGLAATRQEAG